MGKKLVISGGNSGIGLEVGRQLVALGHHVILLGRDATKGQAALDGLKGGPGTAEFHAVDLSTHAATASCAQQIAAAHPTLDGLVLGAGVLMTRDQRTSDSLHPIFSVNYLSRYHLAQRLLPQLKQSPSPTIVLLVPGVPLSSKIDFAEFPRFANGFGISKVGQVQIANYHYVAHLAKAEPGVRAAVMNVGLVATEIMRDMPAVMRVVFKLIGPLVQIPVERSASNAVWLSTHEGWTSGSYWPKPGKPEQSQKLSFDTAVTDKVVAVSKELTGA
ncbi:MAG: hypothetical protein A2138_04360 [Deltaproteobacteria bacterium RBG_16_71_12]|nr:MAG: hypothetical protein A2138_04360 [Deltaproteobacteria bacterium RBG_16_71_12]